MRVYERPDSPVIQIEWRDPWTDFQGQRHVGRVQLSLSTVTGDPVTDKTLARDIAEAVATARERKANQRAAEKLFQATGVRSRGSVPESDEELVKAVVREVTSSVTGGQQEE